MNIRDVRKAKGITQQELGEKTGIDQASISRMERGQKTIKLNDLKVIAEALEVSLEELVRGYASR